jgi:hypothetical protein
MLEQLTEVKLAAKYTPSLTAGSAGAARFRNCKIRSEQQLKLINN